MLLPAVPGNTSGIRDSALNTKLILRQSAALDVGSVLALRPELRRPTTLVGDFQRPQSFFVDFSGLPPSSIRIVRTPFGSTLTLRYMTLAGLAPHPSSLVCGARLRDAGLVSTQGPWPAGCPPELDGAGRSAWGALGLPGGDAPTAFTPDLERHRALAGFVSLLWPMLPRWAGAATPAFLVLAAVTIQTQPFAIFC
jgi:hypothetical protein